MHHSQNLPPASQALHKDRFPGMRVIRERNCRHVSKQSFCNYKHVCAWCHSTSCRASCSQLRPSAALVILSPAHHLRRGLCSLASSCRRQSAQNLLHTLEKISTPVLVTPPSTPPVCVPVILPSGKVFFSTCARKPPLPSVADRKISNTPVHSALKQIISPVNLIDSQIFAVPIVHPVVKFSPRPLQKLGFSAGASIHHSFILQMDGLLFAAFSLRLDIMCARDRSMMPSVSTLAQGHPPLQTFVGYSCLHPPC